MGERGIALSDRDAVSAGEPIAVLLVHPVAWNQTMFATSTSMTSGTRS
jgi:hypothetical protein